MLPPVAIVWADCPAGSVARRHPIGMRRRAVTGRDVGQVAQQTEQARKPDIAEIFRQLVGVGSVELKMNVPSEQRTALRALRMDTLKGRIREVTFFDTKDLALYRHGVVLRARRTQGADDDTVVKLRPAMPGELPAAVRDSRNLKVEMDVTRNSYVVSASLKGRRKPGSVHKVLYGERPLEKLLSSEQRDFIGPLMPEGVGWHDIQALGPIFVVFLKFYPRDLKQRLTIEQWHFPGYVPLVEMSTKTVPTDVVQVYGEVREFLQRYGLSANGEQEAKTRRALEFLSK
jgi:hypothetical protein